MYSFRFFTYLLSITVLTATTVSCKKFQKPGALAQPGIALTFDDDRIDNWYKYLPFLDSAGVKATFYICKYHKFTPQQKAKLNVIKNHGHEIAFHSVNHYNMEDYVYKYRRPMQELVQKEIVAGLKAMNKDGFYPTAFAYPYGAHNPVMDKELLRYFKSVRGLNGTTDFTKSQVATNHNDVLYGLGIDRSSKRSETDIVNVLNSARDNNTCVVLVGHDINTQDKFSVELKRIKMLLQYIKANKFKFYTISEITK